ncbi:hypothetical protein FIU82_08870 [Pseudoalteromonas sp. THAF3]|uniref:hypothetical protein n=1 Tax=Pseudoalteromonas sp. THAF3 TaxID=2587843 RepID=UPI00126904A5|nr:hypothetical protein [Pseudoalteromonas sp. THAF3]QFU05129.1 hypothetical protein FIU82_08870 [Pseudoalteromonas sp. THAF3]
MFNDKLVIKSVILAFLAYLLVTAIASAVAIQVWLPEGVDMAQAQSLASQDMSLTALTLAIGASACILTGMLVTYMTKSQGLRNALALAMLITLYGLLSVFTHLEQPLMVHFAKLALPTLAVITGAYWVIHSTQAKLAG